MEIRSGSRIGTCPGTHDLKSLVPAGIGVISLRIDWAKEPVGVESGEENCDILSTWPDVNNVDQDPLGGIGRRHLGYAGVLQGHALRRARLEMRGRLSRLPTQALGRSHSSDQQYFLLSRE